MKLFTFAIWQYDQVLTKFPKHFMCGYVSLNTNLCEQKTLHSSIEPFIYKRKMKENCICWRDFGRNHIDPST